MRPAAVLVGSGLLVLWVYAGYPLSLALLGRLVPGLVGAPPSGAPCR